MHVVENRNSYFFMAEATAIDVHILNQCPTKSVQDKKNLKKLGVEESPQYGSLELLDV